MIRERAHKEDEEYERNECQSMSTLPTKLAMFANPVLFRWSCVLSTRHRMLSKLVPC